MTQTEIDKRLEEILLQTDWPTHPELVDPIAYVRSLRIKAIKQAFSDLIIGEDTVLDITDGGHIRDIDGELKSLKVVTTSPDGAIRNKLKAEQRKALWGNHEGGKK